MPIDDHGQRSVRSRGPTKALVVTQLAIFLLAAALLIPAVTPSDVVSGGILIKLIFLARIVVLVALASSMLRRRSLSWANIGLNQPSWRRFLIAVPAGALMTVAFGTASHTLVAKLGLPSPDYSMFAPLKGRVGEYLFWALPVSIGAAAFGEELLFRGFITDALRRSFGGSGFIPLVAALITQPVLFGALHFYQGAGGMIAAGVTGLALSLTWLIAGRNLWAGILLHALLDGTAMTAIFLGYGVT